MNLSLDRATVIATKFLVESGYKSPKLDSATFNAEKSRWEVTYDIGYSIVKLRIVIIDDVSQKVIGFERPPSAIW